MRRFVIAIFFCCGFTFSLPHSAQADLITITGGSLQISGGMNYSGPLTLASDRLTADLLVTPFGNFSAGLCLCGPNTTIGTGGIWVSPDVVGTVILDGTPYSGFSSSSAQSILVQFSGPSATFPALWTPQPVLLTQPFTFSGLFFYPTGPGQLASVDLIGGGTSSLTFVPGAGINGWVFDHGNYTFTPVPEPSTLTLFGLGAIGLLRRRFR